MVLKSGLEPETKPSQGLVISISPPEHELCQLAQKYLQKVVDMAYVFTPTWQRMKTTATSIKCDQTGCNYVASHEQSSVANRMISRHKSVAHGIRSAKAISNDKYRRKQGARVGAQFGKRFVSVLRSVPDSVHKMNGKPLTGSGVFQCDHPGCDYTCQYDDPIISKRVMSIHKTKVHGTVSAYRAKMMRYTKRPYAKRTEVPQPQQPSPLSETPTQRTSQVVPAYLCECPNCKTRFYMAKGD